MEILLVIIIGLLYAAGIYMMLRRSLVKLIIGLILLGNGANLLIFLLGKIVKGQPLLLHLQKRCWENCMQTLYHRH